MFVVRWSMANAIAYQVPCAVVFTDRSLEGLSEEDIEGICAHELAHLREPRRIVVLRTASFVGLSSALFASPLAPPLVTLGLAVASFVAWTMVQRWMARFETLADAAAGRDELVPGAYGRALEKLHELNLMPVVVSGVPSHPNLYDRLVAVGAPPSYPPPPPPSKKRLQAAFLTALIGGVVGAVVAQIPLAVVERRRPSAAVALTGGESDPLAAYAAWKLDGDPDAAVVLYRACVAADARAWACRGGLERLAPLSSADAVGQPPDAP